MCAFLTILLSGQRAADSSLGHTVALWFKLVFGFACSEMSLGHDIEIRLNTAFIILQVYFK